MASNLLRLTLHRAVLQRPLKVSGIAQIYTFHPAPVGPDPNINMNFYESLTTPLPPIPRTIAFQGELKDLKEKEKGDWKNLSQEERMDLYNMYYSMSMADMCREQDLWKSILGGVCFLMGVGLMMHWFIHTYILPPYAPTCKDPRWAEGAIRKQIQFHSNPITGYPAMWDYENNCWKK